MLISTSTIGRKGSHWDSPSDPNYARGFIVEERECRWYVHASFAIRVILSRSSSRGVRSWAARAAGRERGIRQSGEWCTGDRNGNQRRRQTWAIIGRYVLLLITIMTAKLGRGYRVRSHGWSACRVYKRCIHLIGIHAASKFLACYPGPSLFLPFVPSSLRPLAPLCLSVPVSIFPRLIADLFPSWPPFFIVARFGPVRVCARARLRACAHKIFSGVFNKRNRTKPISLAG